MTGNLKQKALSYDFNLKTLFFILFFSPLFPEYVAAPMTWLSYPLFKRHCTLENKKVVFGEFGKIFFLYMIFQLVTVIWSGHKILTVAIALMWMGMFLGQLTVTNMITKEELLDRFMYTASSTSAVMGAIALVQMGIYRLFPTDTIVAQKGVFDIAYAFNPFWRKLDDAVFSVIPIDILDILEFDRALSTYSNPLLFASVSVMLVPFSVFRIFNEKSLKGKLIGVVCLGFAVGGIAASYSRGPSIAIVVVAAILLFYGLKKGLAVVIASVPFTIYLMIKMSGRFLEALMGDYAVQLRFDIWKASIEIIKEHWLLGVGCSTQNTWDLIQGVYGIPQPHAHNIFLEIFVECGIFGILLFLAFTLIFAIDMIRTARASEKGRLYAVTQLAAIFGFYACGLTDFVFLTPKELQIFMLVLGMAEAAKRIVFGSAKVSRGDYLAKRREYKAGLAEKKQQRKTAGEAAKLGA
ncbi:MAG: O-antigen ligase family protein [Clostridiales bacterium]|nr:O-antigen ligase family protein [Clostridiales bacterium]